MYGGRVLAASLYGDLGENETTPGEVTDAVRSRLETMVVVIIFINSQFGSDGGWSPTGDIILPHKNYTLPLSELIQHAASA